MQSGHYIDGSKKLAFCWRFSTEVQKISILWPKNMIFPGTRQKGAETQGSSASCGVCG
jgi:hypothetical protein